MNNIPAWRLALCGLPLLVGCGPVAQSDQSQQVQPLVRLSASPGSGHGYLLLGSYYEAQDRPEQAAAAYREAIELEPDSADARNALALLYSAQQRYDEASAELLKAVLLAPNIAKFHNNLGYVYFLDQNYAGAINEFRNALALDPQHTLASNNLEASCEKFDALARQRVVMLTPAAPRHAGAGPCDARNDLAAQDKAPLSNLLDAIVMKVKMATRFIVAPADRAPDKVAVTPTAMPPAFRLEIANGNGVAGLARRVRDALQQNSSPQPRITNLKPFRQRQTVIQYRAGFEEAARQLSAQLSARSIQFAAADIASGVDVRLVLGLDIATESDLLVRAPSATMRVASTAKRTRRVVAQQ